MIILFNTNISSVLKIGWKVNTYFVFYRNFCKHLYWVLFFPQKNVYTPECLNGLRGWVKDKQVDSAASILKGEEEKYVIPMLDPQRSI